MGKIIAPFHTERLKKILDTTKGEIIYGGRIDKEINYVEPTIILNPHEHDSCMSEEIFGPILPIMTWTNIDEVITFVNKREKPLAVYYLGAALRASRNRDRLLNETSSGAFL